LEVEESMKNSPGPPRPVSRVGTKYIELVRFSLGILAKSLKHPAGKLFSPCLANSLVSIFSPILTGASRSPALFASPGIPPCRCLLTTNTAGSRLAQDTAK